MKIACSSAGFADEFAAGTLTQLEWLDACANELEMDGVVCDLADFPRTDDQYLAQVKKTATDLGLTIAAIADRAFFASAVEAEPGAIDVATALGAPIAIASASARNDGADAWGDFTAVASARARAAKRANVTIAVRAARGTVCTTGADLKRLTKDVDSSWLRYVYAIDDVDLAASDSIRAKSVIAWHDISSCATFATPADSEAPSLVAGLTRFRGFVVLAGAQPTANRTGYHDAIARFATLRTERLAHA